MTHDELLAEIYAADTDALADALRAVVELHKPTVVGQMRDGCAECKTETYPCPTIQAVEKELK
jgi:hypothetical protein